MPHMRDRVEATGGPVNTTARDGRTVVEVRAPSQLNDAMVRWFNWTRLPIRPGDADVVT